jgi:hypothetical protein
MIHINWAVRVLSLAAVLGLALRADAQQTFPQVGGGFQPKTSPQNPPANQPKQKAPPISIYPQVSGSPYANGFINPAVFANSPQFNPYNNPFTNPFNPVFAPNPVVSNPFNNPFNTNPFNTNPFNNPFNSPFNTNPFNSPFNNPLNTNPFVSNPFNNPFNTNPFNTTPFNSPFNSPFNTNPFNTTSPFNNPFNNPFNSPFNTNPFINPYVGPAPIMTGGFPQGYIGRSTTPGGFTTWIY